MPSGQIEENGSLGEIIEIYPNESFTTLNPSNGLIKMLSVRLCAHQVIGSILLHHSYLNLFA